MLRKWSLQQWGLHRRVRAHSGRHSHQFVERLPNVQSTRRTVWGGLRVPMQSPNICARRWCPSTRRKKILQGAFGDTLRQYDVPGRIYFSSTAIPHAYNSVRIELQRTPLSVEEFSLTTGLWSSATMAPYMSLTVHFIDQDWKLVSKCLQTSFLPEDHTAVNLADALQDALREW